MHWLICFYFILSRTSSYEVPVHSMTQNLVLIFTLIEDLRNVMLFDLHQRWSSVIYK